MSAGSWDSIERFFKENEAIKPYYEDVTDKLIADGCYSLSTHYIQTIEKLLEIIDKDWDVKLEDVTRTEWVYRRREE